MNDKNQSNYAKRQKIVRNPILTCIDDILLFNCVNCDHKTVRQTKQHSPPVVLNMQLYTAVVPFDNNNDLWDYVHQIVCNPLRCVK